MVIDLSCDLSRSQNQRVFGLYGQELIKVSYNLALFRGHRHPSSIDIMVFVCRNHFDLKPLKVSYHPAKSCGHRHCGSRDMFLVAVGEDSRRFYFNPLLLLSLKDMAWNHTSHHINYFDHGHTRLKHQLEKNFQSVKKRQHEGKENN